MEDYKFICPCIKSAHLYDDINNEIVDAMYKNHKYQNFTVDIDMCEVEESLEFIRVRDKTAFFLVPVIFKTRERTLDPLYNILKMRA